MKNSVKLNSAEWCNIVFEGKNKLYGAYTLRQSSGKRHIIAFGIMILIVAFILVLPSIISKIEAATKNNIGNINEVYTVAVIDNPPLEQPEIARPSVPEPPKFKPMEKFVPPTIAPDDDVPEDEEMPEMEKLTSSKIEIGKFNEEGSDDPDAVRREFEKEVTGEGNTSGQPEPDKIHISVEVKPQFPGGDAEMHKYISDNLFYPVVDREMGVEGRVTIRFVVGKAGEITDVELLKGISPSCDREAIKVVKNMPRWIPGKQNGNPVRVYHVLPIIFRLQK